jgi:hypothetical protein
MSELVQFVGELLPDHPGSFGANLLLRIAIAALVVFPYLLFRFTMAFGRPARSLHAFVSCLSIVLVV